MGGVCAMCEAGLTAVSVVGARSKERVVSVRSVRGLTPSVLVRHVKGKKCTWSPRDEPRCLCVAGLRLWVTDVLGALSFRSKEGS